MKLLKRTKPRQPKKQAIETYTASFLDHRSKSYHKIIMTSFVGLFGVMGAVYLFSSNAASPDAATSNAANNNSMIWVLAGLVTIMVILLLVIVANRKK